MVNGKRRCQDRKATLERQYLGTGWQRDRFAVRYCRSITEVFGQENNI